MSDKTQDVKLVEQGFVALIVGLGAIGTMAAFILLSSLYWGWGFSILWNWFMPCLGTPTLTIPQAIGVGFVLSWVTYRVDLKSTREGWDLFAMCLLKVPIYLISGWLLKWAFGI